MVQQQPIHMQFIPNVACAVYRSYLERLAVELNDCLQHQGHITIAEMSKKYDLPLDIVRDTVHSLLGSVILGEMDNNNGDVIFTSNFVRRMRAQIRGAFTAVTMYVYICEPV